MPRQASDSTDIEITPAMLEAGVGAMLAWYSEDLRSEPGSVVDAVYKAMVLAAPERRSRSLSLEQG